MSKLYRRQTQPTRPPRGPVAKLTAQLSEVQTLIAASSKAIDDLSGEKQQAVWQRDQARRETQHAEERVSKLLMDIHGRDSTIASLARRLGEVESRLYDRRIQDARESVKLATFKALAADGKEAVS